MINVFDLVELAVIINKKYYVIINGKKFKISWVIFCRFFNRYFFVSIDYRFKFEVLLVCL